jgi:hypothetical protein
MYRVSARDDTRSWKRKRKRKRETDKRAPA